MGSNRASKKAQRDEKRKSIREKKEKMTKRLGLPTKGSPCPLHVAFIPVTPGANSLMFRLALLRQESISAIYSSDGVAQPPQHFVGSIANAESKKLQKNFVFLSVQRGIEPILDSLKVADAVVFLFTADGTDELSDELLTAIDIHGSPQFTCAALLPGSLQGPFADQGDLSRFVSNRLPSAKLFNFFSTQNEQIQREMERLLNSLANAAPSPVVWTQQYPAMVIQKVQHSPSGVALTGFLRGTPLNPERVIHVSGLGDYACVQVLTDLSPFERGKIIERACLLRERGKEVEAAQMMVQANPPPVLQQQVAPQPMFNMYRTETPLYSEQQIRAGWRLSVKKMRTYQEAEEIDDQPAYAANPDDIEADQDFAQVIEVNSKPGSTQWAKHVPLLAQRSAEDLEFPDEVDTPQPPLQARQRFSKYRGMASFRTSSWNASVDLPPVTEQLSSLPTRAGEINSLIHESHRDTGIIAPGQWVTLVLQMDHNNEGALTERVEGHNGTVAVCAGLFMYENRMSLAMLSIHRVDAPIETPHKVTRDEQRDLQARGVQVEVGQEITTLMRAPLPGKVPMVLHVGWRRIIARPIYTTYEPSTLRGARSRVLRQAATDQSTFGATAYMPIVLGQGVPVLGFQVSPVEPGMRSGADLFVPDYSFDDGSWGMYKGLAPNPASIQPGTLVTGLRFGGLYARTDPFSLLIKRIILTGYPLKIHKRLAVVRWMFWLPSDVKWFSPVELSARHGISGHIQESCGTHGYFKAVFSRPINFQDTVCMKLYRRVWPPPPYTTRNISFMGSLSCQELTVEGDDDASPAVRRQPVSAADEEWDNADIDI